MNTDLLRQMLSAKIEDLNLSVRVYNSLKRAGVHTLGQVTDLGESGVSKIRNLGQQQLDNVFDAAAEFLGVSRRFLATLALEQSTEYPPEKDKAPSVEGNELSQNVVDFAELFTLAQTEALNKRENLIAELRYGFTGGESHTLEEIGKHIGVSRERIRQILNKCHRKIVARGKRDIRSYQVDKPCGALLLYVNQTIRPTDDNTIERLVDFIEIEVPYLPVKTHALPLIAILAFHSERVCKQYRAEAEKIFRERRYKRWQAYKQHVLWEKFEDLLSFVIWPGRVKTLSVDKLALLGRKREVSPDGEGHAGCFYSSKLNRYVQYESELEHDFLQQLEVLNQVVFYQEQPFEISYEFENRKYLYYPDIFFLLQDGKGIVVEIKPVFKMALQINLKKWTALKHFCSNNGLGLLITDGKYAIQQVQSYAINPQFAKDVLSALGKGTLSWGEYKLIRDKYNVKRNEFLALVLKNRLIWQLNPFRLSASA